MMNPLSSRELATLNEALAGVNGKIHMVVTALIQAN